MELSSGTIQILNLIQEEWKLLTLLTLIFFLYFHYTSTFDFFEKKGVPYMKPTIILGNFGPRIIGKQPVHEYQLDIYNYFKGKPMGGLFEGRRPVLYMFEPELIKAVTIRDFDHFVDRNTLNIIEPKYLARSLLNLKGQEWKGVRSTLTPSFSSARLRSMLPLIEMCSRQMVEYLKKYNKQDVEMKKTMGHFTLEVIGACAFGIKCDAMSDENTHFVKVAEKFNYMSGAKRALILLTLMFVPSMFKHLRLSFLNEESTTELVRILKVAKAERKTSGIKKNDFLQLLLDATDTNENAKENTKNHLDDDTIDAQALLFLIAGYETSSTLLSFAIHTLATKPDLQERLRQHVEEVTSGKELDYDVLAQLTYLEGFLLETLRIYPPVARVDRVCCKEYEVPGTKVQVSPGEVVAIPVYGIHMDPDIYPEPKEFRPERFMGDEKKNRPSHLFLAFGAGPRNCIGLRFAIISAKIAMVSLVKNFKFSVCDKTEDPVPFHRRDVLLKAANGLWVRLDKL